MILFSLSEKSNARPLILCTHLGFEPFIIQKGKSLAGIDIDIIVQALKNAKQPAEIKAYPWNRMLASLKKGTCDIGFSLFDTEERRTYVDYIFAVPLHYSTFSIFVKKGREFTFNKVSDFFGLKVGHNRGFSLTHGLERAINDGHITRVEFDNIESAINMLETGRIDAILDNEVRFKYFLKKHNKTQNINALTVPFLPHNPAFLVVSKAAKIDNKPAIKAMLETQLKKLHLDGTILNINRRYIN